MSDKAIPVRVALRIRPLVTKEITEGSQSFISKVNGQPQVVINGSHEAYTYDYVFGPEETQGQVYDTAVTKIVGKIFKGYNVTILAYGQTGSGKTFTMGTAETTALVNQKSGIIQRAVKDLFSRMTEEPSFSFDIHVSFLELYMEKVFDLLSKNRHEEVDIREDPKSGIRIHGLTETAVASCEDTLKCLEQGSLNRRTGATAMNQQSSRSHAVFTLTINQINKDTMAVVKTSKFHLVDLAGSERASKTLAQGDRFQEGVNINKGLLSLGNVISALCESNPRHIPYRDSKLTRLLQDSLGGNSHTLMIACISPADSNYEETLSTLRYADRARKIKNKPIVNQDPTAMELVQLRALVAQLKASNGGGSADPAEVEQLKQQLKNSEEQKMKMFYALQSALEENTNLTEKALLAEAASHQMKQRLEELQAQAEQTLGAVNQTFNETKELDGAKTIEQLVSLKSKIEEIQDVQRRNEIDQNNHDMQAGDAEDDKENVPISEEEDSPRRLSVIGTDMALRRVKLGDELKVLNAQLAEKVNMVNKMSQQGEPYSLVRAQYEAAVSDLEKQVSALQLEKEELAALLAQASSNANACKISEQRRKRLQELEPQIAELRKKIQEQANVIKLKQRAEEQLKKYNNDIQQMRAQKVKLVRQMREENEKFRVWRVQKEREVARLKDQDRKRQGQLQKMEVLHAKQQNVLRRKMEDAVAVSKRLKEVLSLHNSKAAQSSKVVPANSTETDQRIKSWLMGELDLLTKIKQAEMALEELIESRRTLAARQTKLEGKLAEASDEASINALKSEMAIVSADVSLRSEQIVELKQKIASADMDNKAKTRLEYLQTMVEAKVALKILLEECVGARGEAFHLSSEVQDLRHELEDLQRQHEEAVNEISRGQTQMDQLKKKHQLEMGKLSRDYDERMLTLMRQLPPCGLKESSSHKVSEAELLERLKIQQEELERCCTLQEQLNAALNEIEQLKTTKAPSSPPEMRPPPAPAAKVKKPKTSAPKVFEVKTVTTFTSDEEDDLEYNSDDDPEWRNTPMGKRFKKLKEENFVPPKMADLDGGDKAAAAGKAGVAKRMSRSHCVCRTGRCERCICAKDERSCTKDCSCSALGACKNSFGNENAQQEDPNRILNETFDLGRKRSQENSNNSDEEVENELELPLKKSRLTKVIKRGAFFDD